jgi:hypothetical protein
VAPENQFHGLLLNALTATNDRALHKRSVARNIAVTNATPACSKVLTNMPTLPGVSIC